MIIPDDIREIPQYAGVYYASKSGLIYRRTKKRLKMMTLIHNKQGYLQVGLCYNGARITQRVHRLILSAFYGESDLFVNHINGVKDDNRLCNLEWVTQKQNIQHSINVLGNTSYVYGKFGGEHPRSVGCVQSDFSGVTVNEYSSITEASAATGIRISGISRCILGKIKSCGGYLWRAEGSPSCGAYVRRVYHTRPVEQRTLTDVLVKVWDSANVAGQTLGISALLIRDAARRRGSSSGFRWLYA